MFTELNVRNLSRSFFETRSLTGLRLTSGGAEVDLGGA